MDEKIDQAMQNVLAMIRTNARAEEALSCSQAVLNLAHVKSILVNISTSEKDQRQQQLTARLMEGRKTTV